MTNAILWEKPRRGFSLYKAAVIITSIFAATALVAMPVTASQQQCDGNLTTDAEKHSSAMMNAKKISSATRNTGGVRVVFIGNSITLHGKAPQIGWTNEWGMAASSIDRDYVHLVTRGIENATGRKADVRVRNLADFERHYKTWTKDAGMQKLIDFNPEYLIVALGENVPNLSTEDDRKSYRAAFRTLVGFFLGSEKRPRTVVRGVFWPNPAKDDVMREVADEFGVAFVQTDFCADRSMTAYGLFSHEGVAAHPGDKGMAEIARRILAAMASPERDASGKKSVRVAKTIRPVGTGFCVSPDLHTYLPLHDDYAVSLGGKPVEVRACRESRIPFNRYWPGRQRPLEQTERASYIAFEGEGSVAVTVKPKRAFTNVVVRPLSADVKAVVKDDVISFALPKPGYYVCEVDGTEKALQLFYEQSREFTEKATISYGPGMHMAGIVRLKDHDRVYIDRDAIVFGCFLGYGVRDVKIFGYGVIDGRSVERVFEGCYSELQPGCIRFHRSCDVSIDGPVLLDSPCWVLSLFACDDVDIRHVKIAGQWRYNTDGIDVCNSCRVGIRDCYVRSFDDTIVIKGVPPFRAHSVEDVTIERCVMWCAWGKTLEPGVETWASKFRRVRVSDCDLIHSSVAALNVSAGGTAELEDFLYENIRVELQSEIKREIVQGSDEQKYDPGKTPWMRPRLLKIDNTRWGPQDLGGGCGHVKNLTLRDIKVFTDAKFGKPIIHVNACSAEGRKPRLFENIVLEDFTLNGRKATMADFEFTGNVPIAFR